MQTCHDDKGRTQAELSGPELAPVEVGKDRVMGFGFILGADLQLGDAQCAKNQGEPIEVFLGELPDFVLLVLNLDSRKVGWGDRTGLLHFTERLDELPHAFEPFRRHRP